MYKLETFFTRSCARTTWGDHAAASVKESSDLNCHSLIQLRSLHRTPTAYSEKITFRNAENLSNGIWSRFDQLYHVLDFHNSTRVNLLWYLSLNLYCQSPPGRDWNKKKDLPLFLLGQTNWGPAALYGCPQFAYGYDYFGIISRLFRTNARLFRSDTRMTQEDFLHT